MELEFGGGGIEEGGKLVGLEMGLMRRWADLESVSDEFVVIGDEGVDEPAGKGIAALTPPDGNEVGFVGFVPAGLVGAAEGEVAHFGAFEPITQEI